jgi:hypothetical protein
MVVSGSRAKTSKGSAKSICVIFGNSNNPMWHGFEFADMSLLSLKTRSRSFAVTVLWQQCHNTYDFLPNRRKADSCPR